MSTPGADPSGDYVLKLFAAVDRLRPGAGSVLAAKARRLTGTQNHAQAPGGLNQYAWLLGLSRADLFLTYRTSALAALRDNPALRLVELPASLAVEAQYGLTVLDPVAERLAKFILGSAGSAILDRHGFLRLEHG
jgi:ABC-type molybdate transport system substrate-binding protein